MKMQLNRILLILFVLSIISCSESILNQPPLDRISENDYWKSPADFENYIIQFYTHLPGFGNSFTYNSDSDSDNVVRITVDPILSGRRNRSSGNWISEWTPIRGVNIFLDNFNELNPTDVTQYSQALGEAYFFRSWFYFNLVLKYGDVPWYENEILIDSEEELLKPRNSRTDVVDNILADLDNAVKYLGYIQDVGNNRLNKETALAFQSRIALFEGSWQKYHVNTPFGTENVDYSKYFKKCIDVSRELINSSNYTKGLYSDYYTLFGLNDMSSVEEVLFWKAASVDQGLGHEAQLYVTNWTGDAGVTWSLVSSYLGNDGNPVDYNSLAKNYKGTSFLKKLAEIVDPRLESTIWIPGNLMVATGNVLYEGPILKPGSNATCPTGFRRKKYSNPYDDAAGRNFGGYSETGFIYFRYAEVLLNYAEALYELNNVVAYEALDLLRNRVGMPPFKIIDSNNDFNRLDYGYQIDDALYEIRRERRVELALEDLRGTDYRRWAAHNLFMNKRFMGLPFDSTEVTDYSPKLNNIGLIDFHYDELPNGYQFDPTRDYLYSIPQDEITLNPNLTQNPGW